MSKRKSYVDLILEGDAFLEDINDFIREWHEADTSLEVWEYLGLTEDEYASWAEEPATLRWVINAKANGGSFCRQLFTDAIAARSANPDEARVIQAWLQQTGRI